MSGTKLGLDWGWRRILQAREHDWSLHPVTRFREGGHSLGVRVGGDWRCEHALAAEAVDLLSLFLPLVARTGPLALAQLGQSLDGRIATESGASHYINGLEARTHLHRSGQRKSGYWLGSPSSRRPTRRQSWPNRLPPRLSVQTALHGQYNKYTHPHKTAERRAGHLPEDGEV